MKYFLLAASLLLASCSCERQPQRQDEVIYDNTPTSTVPGNGNTTIIQGHDDHGSDLATGLLLGHVLSNSSGGYNNAPSYQKTKKTKNVTNITNITQVQRSPRGTTRTQARVVQTTRPSYTPSRIRTSTSMSSRAVRRR